MYYSAMVIEIDCHRRLAVPGSPRRNSMKFAKWIKPGTSEVRIYINGAGVEGRPFITSLNGDGERDVWTVKCFGLFPSQLDQLGASVEDELAATYVTCLLYFLTAADIAAGSLTLSKTGTGTDYGASLLVNIFRGVSGLDAFTFAGPTSPIGYPTTVPMTASSITPSASGEAVVMFAAPFTNQYPDDSFTDPAGWTRGAAVATGDTGQLHQYSGFLLNAPTSATGDITATYNVPSNTAGTKTWVAALVALAPGVPPPSPLVLAGTLPAATVGTAWTGVLNFSGDYTGTLTVDASSGTIPAWMGSPTIDYGAKTITWSATPATGTDAGS